MANDHAAPTAEPAGPPDHRLPTARKEKRIDAKHALSHTDLNALLLSLAKHYATAAQETPGAQLLSVAPDSSAPPAARRAQPPTPISSSCSRRPHRAR
jgi:hypothetical protein